ncbi:MAG: hypothetical protein Ct9H90mP5_04090 [Acidimicrobiaceae bacterium]|nr:MAG: hypothetical protein Ct9H90mP5_04090 [Acidimicrobiaceae bacterium]
MGSGANELNVLGYTAAKGGLVNMTYQLGTEWADRGVRVNSVSRIHRDGNDQSPT